MDKPKCPFWSKNDQHWECKEKECKLFIDNECCLVIIAKTITKLND